MKVKKTSYFEKRQEIPHANLSNSSLLNITVNRLQNNKLYNRKQHCGRQNSTPCMCYQCKLVCRKKNYANRKSCSRKFCKKTHRNANTKLTNCDLK